MINGFLGVQGDQAGLRALGGARGQNRRAVKAKTAGDDSQMPERALVPGRGTGRREILKIVRQRPIQPARMRTGNQAHVVRDFEPADKRPRVVREQTGFRRADGQRDRRFNRHARRHGIAGVGIQTGRHVHRQNGNSRLVDRPDDFLPIVGQRPVKPDAEQAVNDQRRFLKQRPLEFRQIVLGRGDVERFNAAAAQKFPRGAGVVAVVALAGENQNRIAGPRELQRALRDFSAHATDDFGLGLAGFTRGTFPFAHLGDADDRK